MDLDEMRAFLAVVDSGSFVSAADQLGLPRATLRRRVEALEARIGATLLERTSRGVLTTEAGQTLAGRGRSLMQEASQLVTSVREVGREPAGVLRIVIPLGMPPQATMAIWTLIQAKYPRLSIHIRPSPNPVAYLAEDAEMALHIGDAMPRGPWRCEAAIRLREWLVARKSYLDRAGRPEVAADLSKHRLFAWDGPDHDPRLLPLRAGGHHEVEPALVAADIHFVRTCAIAGLGIAFVPDGLLPDVGIGADVLEPVLPELIGRERHLRLLVPEVLADRPKVRRVVDELKKAMEATPGRV